MNESEYHLTEMFFQYANKNQSLETSKFLAKINKKLINNLIFIDNSIADTSLGYF